MQMLLVKTNMQSKLKFIRLDVGQKQDLSRNNIPYLENTHL